MGVAREAGVTVAAGFGTVGATGGAGEVAAGVVSEGFTEVASIFPVAGASVCTGTVASESEACGVALLGCTEGIFCCGALVDGCVGVIGLVARDA